MTNENLLREINLLPTEAQRQVKDFVAFLRQRYQTAPPATSAKADFAKEVFVGIWRDREDMRSGANWVQEMRQSHWRK